MAEATNFGVPLKPYSYREHLGATNNALFLDPCKKRFELVAEIVSGDVLDIGCGYGELESYLKKGTKYTGIDATEWAARVGHNIHCDLMNYTIEHGNKHDWVVALGVIETYEDLQSLADKLNSLAKVGVIVSFHTQCDKPFIARTDREVMDCFKSGEVIELNRKEKILIHRVI